MSSKAPLFSFPSTVNDVAARAVATGVVIMGLLVAGLGWGWVLVPMTYGFLARVASGPRFSPLGQLATKIVAPRLPRHEKIVPGPPKRFAQGIGVAFSATASLLWLVGAPGAARIVVAFLVAAAMLEAAFGFCLGCRVFGVLMRLGVIPEDVCEECNDLSLRIPGLASSDR